LIGDVEVKATAFAALPTVSQSDWENEFLD
jgi:hypothetical protein